MKNASFSMLIVLLCSAQALAQGEPASAPAASQPAPEATSCPDGSAVSWPETRADGAGVESPLRVVFTSVDITRNRFTLRNVSNEAIDFDADGGWALAIWPRTEDFPSGVVIPVGGHLTVFLTESGTNTADSLYLGLGGGSAQLDAERDELSVFSNHKQSGPFLNPAELEAFVRWGAPSQGPTTSIDDEASQARIWTTLEFVRTSEGDAGIVATGDLSGPAGWTTADADCFGP